MAIILSRGSFLSQFLIIQILPLLRSPITRLWSWSILSPPEHGYSMYRKKFPSLSSSCHWHSSVTRKLSLSVFDHSNFTIAEITNHQIVIMVNTQSSRTRIFYVSSLEALFIRICSKTLLTILNGASEL